MRRYGVWPGLLKGSPEMPAYCVAEVADNGIRRVLSRQCRRSRGYGVGKLQGLLCAQHAKLEERGRPVHVPVDQ